MGKVQALILAAGFGSRLGDITKDQHKSTLPVKGKSIIEWQVDFLQKMGVDEIIVVVGYKSETVEAILAGKKNIRFVYNPFYDKCNVLGSVYMALPYINSSFYYLHGDTLFQSVALRALNESSGEIRAIVDRHPCGDEEMKVLANGEGTISNFSKEIVHAEAYGEFIGIGYIQESVLPQLKSSVVELLKKGQLNSYFEAALNDLIANKSTVVKAVEVPGLIWNEVDFPQDYALISSKFPIE